MLGGIKKFVKTHMFKQERPVLMSMTLCALECLVAWEKLRHSRMSYAEIEKAIGRKYRSIFGRPLNWENPQTYNEKVNVSKVYMPSPLKARLADKVAVREWVAEKIGEEYLVPLIGVYDSFDDIDFDALPDKFVIKCSHDSASVTLVKDKRKLNMALLRWKYSLFMRRNFAWMGFELHYRDIPHKIIIEQYIDNAAVNDYRFYCFDGRPYFCAVDYYGANHVRDRRNIYGMEWDLQPFTLKYPNYTGEAPCPENFGELKEIARKLAEGFGHVRVDLYSAGGRVYFGEMTFTHANGLQKFIPDEWDYKLGELWPFDNTARARVLAEHSRP